MCTKTNQFKQTLEFVKESLTHAKSTRQGHTKKALEKKSRKTW